MTDWPEAALYAAHFRIITTLATACPLCREKLPLAQLHECWQVAAPSPADARALQLLKREEAQALRVLKRAKARAGKYVKVVDI